MFKLKKRRALRAAIVLSVTLLVLSFQNCSGSFRSINFDKNLSSSNQSTSDGVSPQPTNPSGAGQNTSNIFEYKNFKAISGFKQLVNLNGRICSIDEAGAVSCIGTLESTVLKADNTPFNYFTDKLTNLNWNLNVVKLLDTCLLTADEKVYCRGDNRLGSRSTPVEVNLGEPVKSIAQVAGGLCASLASGIVKCWGYRLDLPIVNGSAPVKEIPESVTGLANVKEVFANLYPAQFCALLNNNDIYCWGRTIESADSSAAYYPGPTKVYNASDIKKITTGTGDRFCILFNDGNLSCFKNKSANSAVINLETKLSQVVEVASNEGTRCARLQSGDVYCWGSNMFGRLGFVQQHGGSVQNPILIPEFKNAVSISASMYNTCALMSDTTVKCLGLANGAFVDNMRAETTLSQLGVNDNVTAIMASPYYGLCFQLQSGQFNCVGNISLSADFSVASNSFQIVGDEIVAKPSVMPDLNLNSLEFVKVTTSSGQVVYSGCYIDSNQSLKCFGDNQNGQLGNGTTTSSSTPVTVMGLTNVVKVQDYGGVTRCALTIQNRLYCWGDSMIGGLSSLGLSRTQNLSPVEVMSVGAIKDFKIDYRSLTVTQLNGTIKTYGGTDLFDLVGAKKFDYNSLCAQMTDNTVSCYQYGNGTTTQGYKKIDNVLSTSGKFFGQCLINDAKLVQCWGGNSNGDLGQGDRLVYSGAMTVKGISNASLVFTDENSNLCAYVDENLGDQSRILCWSDSFNGNNILLAVFEKTDLRGYKPVMNNRDIQVQNYINSAGQLKMRDTFRIARVPYYLLQKK